jgi:DNA repair protein RecN (Recombination protein N)
MIRFLSIQRLAVIDALEVELGPGLTVLTGETGAGKSILVEGLSLLLGTRATPGLVRTGESSASVQAAFETPTGQELVVRRDVSIQGRSRAFVDGVLTPAGSLRDLTSPLIDLHGQHEHQMLLDRQTHLDAVDAYGDLMDQRAAVAAAFDRLRRARAEFERMHLDERDRAARLDLLSFQIAELDRLAPRPNEDEELAAVVRRLGNAEKLQRLCAAGYETLYEGDAAVLASLGRVWKQVADLASLDAAFEPFLQARDGIKPQLEELAYFLRSYGGTLEASPAHLQEAADRLAAIERLKRKHGGTLAAVMDRWSELKAERAALERSDERVEELGEALRPLAQIASGGELSRVALALKTLASTDAPGKTLVFDEVDAGIGGRVADVVGRRLRRVAERCQVLCITHLPQIAAYGDQHLHVTKIVRRGRTVTMVEALDGRRRVEEIARMLGGAAVTDRVRRTAREMLVTRSESEYNTKGESETAKAKGKRVG